MPDTITSQIKSDSQKAESLNLSDENMNEAKENKKMDFDSLDFHTMPEKFIGIKPGKSIRKKKPRKQAIKRLDSKDNESGKDKGKGDTKVRKKNSALKRQIMISVSIIVVLGVVMSAGAYFFVRNLRNQQNKTITAIDETVKVDETQGQSDSNITGEKAEDANEVIDNKAPLPPISDSEEENNVDIKDDTPPDDSESKKEDSTKDSPKEKIVIPFIDPELLDVDKDLLTVEEERLFGTSDTNFDYDGDGFLDGQEVLNMFDPRFGQGALLADSTSVKTYISDEFGYKIFVPTSWVEKKLEPKSTIRFISNSPVSQGGIGEFVDITVESNVGGFSTVEEWYVSQFPGVDSGAVTSVPAQGGMFGIMSPDGMSAFFMANNLIYSMIYTPSADSNAYFETVFNMMARSFTLFDDSLDNM